MFLTCMPVGEVATFVSHVMIYLLKAAGRKCQDEETTYLHMVSFSLEFYIVLRSQGKLNNIK